VLNAAFLLRRAPAGRPSFDRAVAIIERQVTLMARLIDDLLEISRISRGKIFLRRAPLDLAEAVRSVVEDRREDLSARGLRLEVSLPDGPLWVEADAARVSQAVSNLLENAEKYTDRGGRIRVEVRPEGDSAAVSVADTGIGLSRSDLDRIFSPFVQVDSGRRKSSGLGLGLALVKTLAELHGGSAQAQSEGLGRGATFTLRLPRSQVPRDSAASPSKDREGRPRKILIVEDNPDAAESLRLMLELDRHQVAVASSAEEGLVRARAWHPDVVLSDVGLPGASGYELAQALRAESSTKPHLVAITGYGQAEDRERALHSGFERHVTKPFDHATLERVLAALDGP
jgi:CheY-like chemotaxis protein